MRGGYEFPNATDAELEDALDWAGSKVYYKRYVKLSGVEDLEIGLEDLWIADAKIRGSNLVLEISGQEIGNEAGTQSDVERHLQEAYDPY
jgi:hypothetical protein